MVLEVFACSDVGIQRSKNEDNLYFNGLIKEESAETFNHYEKMNIKKSRAAFGVFDGMGGYPKGEHAAFITADTAKSVLKDNRNGSPKEILKKICAESNSNVCEEIKESGQKMGATLSILYFENGGYFLCNIGDSPVYIFRKGELEKISFEHTESAAYEKIYGEAPPKDKKFPLTQHIGMNDSSVNLNPFYRKDRINEGDIFLICSDGLTDMLNDAEISRIINSSRPLSDIGKILLKNSLDHGGKDNITFVLIKATDIPTQTIEIPKREYITEETAQHSESYVKKQADEKIAAESERKKELENERQAIMKIIVGTVIFSVAVLAIAFCWVAFHADSYDNSSEYADTYISDIET